MSRSRTEPRPATVVLVGTYKGDQLDRWPGWYCWPLAADAAKQNAECTMHNDGGVSHLGEPSAADKFPRAETRKRGGDKHTDLLTPDGVREDMSRVGSEQIRVLKQITELWLFQGTKAQKTYRAEFAGIKTREELIRDYGYPAKGKPHGDRYALFKTELLYTPTETAETVIVRTRDFAKRSPNIAAQLKAFLESRDRNNPDLAKLLPDIVVNAPPERLCVCDLACQLSFWDLPGMESLKPDVPFPPPENSKFTFIDLFAGIGGFHLAMHALGGKCVFASEWDKEAQKTYEANYGIIPFGDITKIDEKDIPSHDVLCAGFPCQPFSKAGQQLGFNDETKGTLFFDIERILKYHKTQYIILENVRNLVAHDHGNTWRTIHSHLVSLGYRLTPEPLIVSPHFFGVPQLRERVVVLGVYDPEHSDSPLEISLPQPKRKEQCCLDDILEPDNQDPAYALTPEETEAINTWDEFYHGIKEKVIGFPIWFDWFKTPPSDGPEEMPEWKKTFVRKNNQLYQNNREFIDGWSKRHGGLCDFTPTMRKMEWQCGRSVSSAWDAFMQMRPSGLRIKRPDCAPALVAIVQVPIIGKYHRRMTVREAARLQSFPDAFIPNPDRHEAYKQFGNAVNVEVIKQCATKLFGHE